MTNLDYLPLIVAYAPGSGGSFLGSLLRSSIMNYPFAVENDGKCHVNQGLFVSQYTLGTSIHSFRSELNAIDSIMYPTSSKFVLSMGHVRNLVAVLDSRPDAWFIKIEFDPGNNNHIDFMFGMLMAKMPPAVALAKCYQQVRDSHWPNDLKDFLSLPNWLELLKEQFTYTMQNWFWIENRTTKDRTLTLTLEDIFLAVPGDKLCAWFDDAAVERMWQPTQHYQQINQTLYPDLYKLIHK